MYQHSLDITEHAWLPLSLLTAHDQPSQDTRREGDADDAEG